MQYAFSGYLDANTDVIIRHGFVRKVFGILLVQLAVTFGTRHQPSADKLCTHSSTRRQV